MGEQKSFLDPGYTPPPRKVLPEPVAEPKPIGEKLRDEAMESVLTGAGPEFSARAKAVIRTLSGEFTGEDIRCACEAAGVIPPYIMGTRQYSNSWGALVGSLVRCKMLVGTGRYIPMKAPDSHARKTAVYRMAVIA